MEVIVRLTASENLHLPRRSGIVGRFPKADIMPATYRSAGPLVAHIGVFRSVLPSRTIGSATTLRLGESDDSARHAGPKLRPLLTQR
jgi:hypothetical protein